MTILIPGPLRRGGRLSLLGDRGRELYPVIRMKVISTFYRRMIYGHRPLDEPIPCLRSRLTSSIELLGDADLPAYREFRPDQESNEIESRIRSGCRCYVTWHEGLIVDASWVATQRVHIPYLGREMILKPGDICVFDSYTLAEHRARGLYMAKACAIMRHCREAGYRRNVAVVAVENRAPLAMTRRLGARFIGMYFCARLGPWQRTWQERWGPEPLPELV